MYFVRPPYLLKKVYPHAIWRIKEPQKKLYLTFDDGPIPVVTTWVLDVLKKKNVRATFFCVGENIVKHPEIYKRIREEGHAVGNHTFNHLKGWSSEEKKYIENVEMCDQVLRLSTEKEKLFRPPYGKVKWSQLNKLSVDKEGDYKVILWDVLSGDYDKATSPDTCLKNVTSNLRKGSIIVFHDNIKAKTNLEYALPRFIEYAHKKGYEFAKL